MHQLSRLVPGTLLLLTWALLGTLSVGLWGCSPQGSDPQYRSQVIKRDDPRRKTAQADAQTPANSSSASSSPANSNQTDSTAEIESQHDDQRPQEGILPEDVSKDGGTKDDGDSQRSDSETSDSAADDPATMPSQPEDPSADGEDPSEDQPSERPAERPTGRPSPEQVRLDAAAARAAAEEAEPFVPPPPPKKGSDGVLDLTFDHIKFDMAVGDPFERSMLPERIEDLNGQKVRIRGYILPGFQQRDIKQFVLVRDNMECCFGPGAALFDCVLIEMVGKGVNFTVRPVTVEGVFEIDEYKSADGDHLAIYRMDGKSVK